jgi:hypothetical protein
MELYHRPEAAGRMTRLFGPGPLESGTLVEIMPEFRRRALAVSFVVAHRSNLSRRVRAFMKWIEDVLTPSLE